MARGFVSKEPWVCHAAKQSKYIRSLNLSDKNTRFATLSIFAVFMPSTSHQKQYFSFVFQKQYWTKDRDTITECQQYNQREEYVLPFSTLLMTWAW